MSSDAVRKTVTVLFCDLVGSTAFGEAVDTESVREAMGRYHEMAQAAVEANGGSVAKFIGDGVMVVFGIPEVAEDDADRAVSAGLELQRRFGPIGDHVLRRYGVELGLRVGVNTGEVVIAADDADIVGDALNTAARLEAACTPGQVLVGEDTWRLTRSTVKYEVLEEVAVKGKAQPVATFQVVNESRGEEEVATPLVGRAGELDELRRVFAEAVDERGAKLVTVVGAPGVGKTRLASELVGGMAGEALAFELRCEPSGAATFAPVAELLRSVLGIEVDHDSAQAMAGLEELIDDGVPDRDRLIGLLGNFVGATAPRTTEEDFFAVRRLLEILGAGQPVLIVVDDIQWAELLFLDLLEHLVEWVKDAPVLIVALARPEIRELRPTLAEAGHRVAAVLPLDGLDAAATEQLAALLLGAGSLPPDLAARLPASTQGNPLFVRELIRMLVDDGVIARTDAGWELTIDPEALQVPPTIQSLLAARVERMPAAERHVLELAAVVGSEFPRGAVQALDEDLSAPRLDVALETLRRREAIDPTGTYWGDEPLFRFHHVLIRDAAYRRLLKGTRAHLHERVGDWTERTAANLASEYEATIAFHFERAYEYRTELDLLDDHTEATGERAAALLHTAAARALERDDLDSTGGLAKRALRCLAADNPIRSDLLLLACEALLGSGDVTAGRSVLDELEAIADGPRLIAWAACFGAQLIVLTAPDELALAEASAGEAADQLAALGDDAGVAKARQVRAGALARLGRVGDCEDELDLALTAARAAKDQRRVTAVLGAAPVAALWGPSPIPRAGGRCLDVMRLLRITAGSPAVEATSVRCQAVLEALRGRFDTARSMLGTARATADEFGLRHGLMETDLYHGMVELLAGRPVEAEPYLRRAYGGLGKLGIGADAGQAAAYLARALLLQGRLDEAEELAADSDALAGQNPQTRIAARSAQAEIYAATGRFDEAVTLAERAVATAAGTDIIVDHAYANMTLARVREAAGDHSAAGEARAEAQRLFHQKGATVEVGALDQPNPEQGDLGSADPSGPPGQALDNGATGAVIELLQRFAEGDVAAARACLAGDFIRLDRRQSLAATPMDADTWVVSIAPFFETVGGEITFGAVAVRGDDLALVEGCAESEHGFEVLFLAIASQTEHGLIDRFEIFDSDGLPAAVAELDRLYTERLAPRMAALYREYLRFDRLINAGDLDGALAIFDPDVEIVDHRDLGFGPQSTIRDRLSSLIESTDSRFLFDTKIHWLDHDLLAMSRRYLVTTADGGHITQDVLACTQVDPASGLVIRVDQFGQDDVAEALVMCHDISASLGRRLAPVNLATWCGAHLERLAGRGDIEQFAGRVARGCVIEGSDGSTRAVNPSEIRSGGVRVTDLGFGGGGRRLIAVGEDRLALVGKELPDGTHAFVIEEIDDDDLLCRVTCYELAQLRVAADRLDDRLLELFESGEETVPSALRVMHDFARASREYDIDRTRELLLEDHQFVDHRPLGVGVMDRDGLVEAKAATADTASIRMSPVLHAISAHGVVSSFRIIELVGDRGWTEAVTGVAVYHVVDDKVARMELFPAEQLDAALARFDELSAEATDSIVENAASRAWLQLVSNLNRGHPIDELLADDFVREDRRSVVTLPTVDREGYIAQIGRILYEVGATRWTVAPFAARTDRHCLGEASIEFDDGGSVLEFLALGSVDDDGLLSRLVLFDVDDLAAAVGELDLSYAEQLAPPLAAAYAEHLRFSERVAAGDLEGSIEGFHPAATIVDHRDLGWGPESTIRDRVSSMFSSTDARFVFDKEVHWFDPAIFCVDRRHVLTTTEGNALTQDVLLVVELEPTTGLCVRTDQYGVGRLADALARCRDRSAAAESDLVPANSATWAGANLERVAGRGDLERFVPLIADDCVIEGADGSTRSSGRSELRSGSLSMSDLGFGIGPRRLLAVREDRLALVSKQLSNGTPMFAIEEIDANGRLCRVVHYALDRLSAAADHLNDRYLEFLEGGDDPVPASVPVMVDWARANTAYDVEAKRALLADDFEQVDHRSLGFSTMDREAVLEATVTMRNLASVGIAGVIHTIASHGMVTSWTMIEIVGVDGWTEAMQLIGVSQVVGDKIARQEFFPEDQLDAALARFEELRPKTRHRLENTCTRSGNRHVELILTGDSTAPPDDLFSPDFVSDDRRSTVNGGVLRGAAAIAASYEVFVNLVSLDAIRATALAIRGDRLALVHVVFDVADFVLDFLAIESIDAQGRRDRTVLLDLDALADAFEELNRLHLEREVPPYSDYLSVGYGMQAALNRGDVAAFAAAVPENLRVVDHRNLGWPELDRQALIDLSTTPEAIGRGIVGTIEFLRVGARAVVSTNFSFVESADDLVEPTWDYLTVSYERSDYTVIEFYPVDALPTALDRFEELERGTDNR